ncbi:hypothetical protein N0V90_001350 [Kalmusia sp. IMI 367209]|nr:hypothetical protein N0V90_001350 [Kalmusia sp. IMI 367209]
MLDYFLINEPIVITGADRTNLLEETRHVGVLYGERFAEIVRDTDAASLTQFNAMDKQPFAHSGTYITAPEYAGLTGRVIFLGDANHAVSPFAGNGANLALMNS